MRMHNLFGCLARLCLSLCCVITLACGGDALRQEAAARRALLSAPLPPPGPLALDAPGPYQVGLRISEGILEKMVWQALAPRVDTAGTPTGAVNLQAFLHLDGVRVALGRGCGGCVRLILSLEVGLSAPRDESFLGTLLHEAAALSRTSADVGVSGRFALVRGDKGPVLLLRGLTVDDVKITGAMEASITNPKRLIEGALNAHLDVASPGGGQALEMPLPASITLGQESLTLTAVGVTTRPGEGATRGELFVGFATNLPAAGSLQTTSGGADLEPSEWALEVSAPALEAWLARHMARIDAEPTQLYDLERLTCDAEGLHWSLRMWDTGRRPWTQAWTLDTQPRLDGETVRLTPADAKAGEGRGALRRAPTGPDATFHARLPGEALLGLSGLSMRWLSGADAAATPLLTRVETSAGRLSIIGRVKLTR